MAWKIELSTQAQKNLDQLDPQIARRILSFLNERVVPLDDPRSIGEALKGARLGKLWKYRVGDYRIISSLEDSAWKILSCALVTAAKCIARQLSAGRLIT